MSALNGSAESVDVRRVLLFDIDGTLVWGGPAKDAFEHAMHATFGTAGDVEGLSFAGKTDPQIARELLTGAGFDVANIESGFEELWLRYTGRLEELLADRPVTVLPGVVDLLAALTERADVGLALLTGNIARGAELKLRSGGLFDYFGLGSYGSDHEERNELPAIAIERARKAWGLGLVPADHIVIGDTPRDVTCGRAGGTRTVAVATGSFAVEELVATGADHVVEDLSATAEVVSMLTA